MPPEYNIGEISKLTYVALTEGQILDLCLDHFQHVYDDVASIGLTKTQRVKTLIDYVKRNDERIRKLVDEIKELNSPKYENAKQNLFTDQNIKPESSQKEIPKELRYLCDRNNQKTELKKVFDKLREKSLRPKSPLLFIIHGNHTQHHYAFVEHISDPDQLKELYKPEIKQTKGGVLEIEDAHLSNLTKNLQEQADKIFAENNAISTQPLIIESHVTSGLFATAGKTLITEFITFWNNYKILSNNDPVIICFSIRYKKDKLDWWKPKTYGLSRWKAKKNCKKLLKEMTDTKFAEFNNLECVVLSELSDVKRRWVLNWANSKPVSDWWDGEKQYLLDTVSDIFRDHRKDEIPMRTLNDELKSRLRKDLVSSS